MKTKKLLFILNPRAGRNKPHGPLFDALAILSGAGYLIRIHETSAPGDAADTAAREGAGYDLVVAAGGDGTLNEVISGLMRLDAPPPLGYLPQGTTNDFASSLQIPRTPASAAKNIVQNRMRELDIGRWNERSFIYVASFGAFTRSSYAASQAAKNALGHFAYILEGMKDLNTLRPYHIRLTADGEVLDGDYLFGAVCNSTSIGGLMKLDPERVVLDDGKFEMLLVPSPKTAADLQNLVLALLNQQYDSQGLVFRHVSSLRLETEEELPWSLDGEYAPSVPVVDIVNRQRALRMLLCETWNICVAGMQTMCRGFWAPGTAMPSSVPWWSGRTACTCSSRSAPPPCTASPGRCVSPGAGWRRGRRRSSAPSGRRRRNWPSPVRRWRSWAGRTSSAIRRAF